MAMIMIMLSTRCKDFAITDKNCILVLILLPFSPKTIIIPITLCQFPYFLDKINQTLPTLDKAKTFQNSFALHVRGRCVMTLKTQAAQAFQKLGDVLKKLY